MADPNPQGQQDVFDVRKIRRLVELMREHDLSEMDLRQGETRIQIRRGSLPVVTAPGRAPAPVAAALPAAEPAAAAPVAAAGPAKAPPADDGSAAFIRSPMVGTFYSASDPDSAPYVKVGDIVGPETTVCIVEAMKVFNEIQAEAAGKIVAVLVGNGEPVEFGQPLFKLDTRT
jgi:acetyl-CoA carboxylase biotin carboxyl carrier protein